MGLVGYSDSEDSGDEQKPAPNAPAKANTSTKPAFQKVIDPSNPHRIKVTLPEALQTGPTEGEPDDGPPAKRAKVGGGTFSGFNALLPAPKRQTVSAGGTNTGLRRGGLGSGVNLKTGATPGFSREPMPAPEAEDGIEGDTLGEDGGAIATKAVGASSGIGLSTTTNQSEKSEEEPKTRGNAMMFKPLSVARKPQKKKKPSVAAVPAVQPVKTRHPAPPPKAAPKISLFSMSAPEKDDTYSAGGSGAYKPLVYQASTTDTTDQTAPSENTLDENFYINLENTTGFVPPSSTQSTPGSQSLDSIASDLNLSASAKRQLFGRQRNHTKGNPAAINVVNFNTDQEYAANELLRQAGEQAVHNPVRAIASGKHSLKQLVNAASNQKDALEEHFASGRRNKKEAGSKYGW
ncbi:hypothetical protein MMC30_003248 [Trapelia coarctata]|nr:hypothetical protein [Trapelia coarctata]